MKIQAFQANGLTESVVAYAQFLRMHGMNIGIQETQDALRMACSGILINKSQFKYGLQSLFCSSPEEEQMHERLFSLYWDTNPLDLEERRNKTSVQGVFERKANASLIMLGRGHVEAPEEEAREVSGANAVEQLKQVDLAKLSQIDSEFLEELAQRLFQEMAVRLRRKLKRTKTKGLIDMRTTIRQSIATGGEPIVLHRKRRSRRRRRLIVLLDVSGSMDKYSFFLLRFICALRAHFRQLEAFVFSTSLKRITRPLHFNRLDTVLRSISEMADNWSSGTKIGECFSQFNEVYGKRLLNGSPTFLILSDGLDTGGGDLLQRELAFIRQRSKQIIWMNPLKGTKGYVPIAAGMSAALPMVDAFRSAHNLQSILELENLLADV